jgi:hypothetical protein
LVRMIKMLSLIIWRPSFDPMRLGGEPPHHIVQNRTPLTASILRTHSQCQIREP